jgi:hypothetical protein
MNVTDKFIDTIEVKDWEVLTNGNTWNNIDAIGKTIEYNIHTIITDDGYVLNCADDHIVINEYGNNTFVKNIKIGDKIHTINGLSIVKNIIIKNDYTHMFDLQLSRDTNHLYYTNGILSHNSMWMQNITCNAANTGRNIVIITIEMSSKKVMKRLGSMRLKIPVKDYDDLSKDTMYMKNKINQLKKTTSSGLFGEGNSGKIFVKKFPTGMCTVADIDIYLTKLKEIKKIDIDMVVVDYLNLMSVEKHNKDIRNNLYLKGKHLAEGLRYLADKHNVSMITVTQVDRTVWGASDVNLNDIPESKAVAETADTIFGIIRNPEMKKHDKYKLKLLKLRDGENMEQIINFDFNKTYLTIENDNMIV